MSQLSLTKYLFLIEDDCYNIGTVSAAQQHESKVPFLEPGNWNISCYYFHNKNSPNNRPSWRDKREHNLYITYKVTYKMTYKFKAKYLKK